MWNTVTQLQTAYVTWVDSIALNAIGACIWLENIEDDVEGVEDVEPPYLTGYKYYIVYMPLVILQWIFAWKCMWPLLVSNATVV